MFYFENLYGNKVLKSDYLKDVQAFFTTRSVNEDVLFKQMKANRIIRPVQTHSSNVQIVDKQDEYPDTDGLILHTKGDIVCLKFADCTPIIFYDHKLKITAITHAGWRGTAQKIAIKTAEKMINEFKSKLDDIVTVIGPAISKCCYEVSDEVKEALLKTVENQDDLFCNNNVDLKGINAQQLKEIGIYKTDICPYCTSCNNDLFYSYRKENGTTNRHKAVVML